jgi:hypothetical protein
MPPLLPPAAVDCSPHPILCSLLSALCSHFSPSICSSFVPRNKYALLPSPISSFKSGIAEHRVPGTIGYPGAACPQTWGSRPQIWGWGIRFFFDTRNEYHADPNRADTQVHPYHLTFVYLGDLCGYYFSIYNQKSKILNPPPSSIVCRPPVPVLWGSSILCHPPVPVLWGSSIVCRPPSHLVQFPHARPL